MAIVKGPFDVKWGEDTLLDIEEISFDYSQDSNDFSTLDGRNISIDGNITASATVTFLASDIPSLAVVLPQYYVASGKTLSTGQLVSNPAGAIDIAAASCATESVYNNLDVYACGTNAEVLRLVRARTKVDSIDIGDGIRRVSVQFIGEPVQGQGSIQFLVDNETFVS